MQSKQYLDRSLTLMLTKNKYCLLLKLIILITLGIIISKCLHKTTFRITCDSKRITYKLPENKITPMHLKILVESKKICKIQKGIGKPFVFSYVFNKVDNFAKRMAIRKTWANKLFFPHLKIAFMVGLSKNESINKIVREESKRYGDIVVGNYIDSLRNLSFKSVMAWQWINNNCRYADYILKVDDDTLVNTFSFMNFINSIKKNNKNLNNTYFCEILKKEPVERHPLGKYFTTCEEYWEGDYFKEYCCGVANIITPDLIPKLHNASYTVRPFHVDDAYVGFVTDHLNVSMIDIVDKMVFKSKKGNVIDRNFLFVRDADTHDDIYNIWNFILEKYI